MSPHTTTTPSRIVRGWRNLTPLTGYKPTRLREMVAAGEFPAPIQLGPRALGWYEADVIAWQSSRQRKQREVAR